MIGSDYSGNKRENNKKKKIWTMRNKKNKNKNT